MYDTKAKSEVSKYYKTKGKREGKETRKKGERCVQFILRSGSAVFALLRVYEHEVSGVKNTLMERKHNPAHQTRPLSAFLHLPPPRWVADIHYSWRVCVACPRREISAFQIFSFQFSSNLKKA
jgi:hypothetical protein